MPPAPTLTLLVAAPPPASDGHRHPPTQALQSVPGVLEVTINPRTGTAFVRCDPRHLDIDKLHAALTPATTHRTSGRAATATPTPADVTAAATTQGTPKPR